MTPRSGTTTSNLSSTGPAFKKAIANTEPCTHNSELGNALFTPTKPPKEFRIIPTWQQNIKKVVDIWYNALKDIELGGKDATAESFGEMMRYHFARCEKTKEEPPADPPKPDDAPETPEETPAGPAGDPAAPPPPPQPPVVPPTSRIPIRQNGIPTFDGSSKNLNVWVSQILMYMRPRLAGYEGVLIASTVYTALTGHAA